MNNASETMGPSRSTIALRAAQFLVALVLLAAGLRGTSSLVAQAGNAEPDAQLSPEAAASAAAKFYRIEEAFRSGLSFGALQITEPEANSYLRYELAPSFPSGVSQVRLTFQPNRILGSSVVDFDKLKEGRRVPPNPLADFLLRGEHTVAAQGTVWGANGAAEFHLEWVTLDGVTLPRAVVEFLIEYYLQSRFPGAAINRPFLLPFAIDSLRAETGSVVLASKAQRQ